MSAQPRHSALPAPARRMLSRPEAAAYVGVGPTLFDKLREAGQMPAPVRVYGRTLWDLRALDSAIDALSDGGQLPQADPDANEWNEVLK